MLFRSLGEGIVLPRPNLRGKACVEERASCYLRSDGNTECHPCQLESIAQKIKVASCEDENHSSGVGQCRRAGVLPAKQRPKERVVVREVLARSSARSGRLARSREGGQLSGSLCGFGLDVFGDGTWNGRGRLAMTSLFGLCEREAYPERRCL